MILLEENGIVEYRDIDEKFNPARQQVVKKIPTPNKELVGMVVESIRPGFELGNVVIRKEKVAVYILQKGEWMQNTIVIKRDGRKEPFDFNKILKHLKPLNFNFEIWKDWLTSERPGSFWRAFYISLAVV